jgi:hypothetical protein
VGALVVLVDTQLSMLGLYLPPLFMGTKFSSEPPQIIISLPVQTAVWVLRASGTLVLPVGAQLSVFGLYLAPVLKIVPVSGSQPPHTIISLPVQTVLWKVLASGAFVVLVGVQVFVVGLYFPPVFKGLPNASTPPQTIISVLAHTAV